MATEPPIPKRILAKLRSLQKQVAKSGDLLNQLAAMMEPPPSEPKKPRRKLSTEEIRALRAERNKRS